MRRDISDIKQAVGFAQTMAKARDQLTDLSARLGRGQGRKSRDKVEADIADILKPRWLDRVISVTLRGEEPAEMRITWRTKPKAIDELAGELSGKRVIFTDHDDWSIADVIAGYRSQSDVEADFRQMKDPKVVSFSPMSPPPPPDGPPPWGDNPAARWTGELPEL